MTSPAEFTRRMSRLGSELQGATKDAVGKAALDLTQSARRNITVASGGDSRLSHVGKRGAKVGARYDVKGTQNPTALVRALGPLQIIERDTQAHDIVAGRTRTGRVRRGGAKALNTPHGPRASVHHPGTRGKHPFGKAVDAYLPTAGLVFQREISAAMRRLFR